MYIGDMRLALPFTPGDQSVRFRAGNLHEVLVLLSHYHRHPSGLKMPFQDFFLKLKKKPKSPPPQGGSEPERSGVDGTEGSDSM